MKITVDGVDLLELTETQKSVMKYFIHEDEFEQDMKRRISWIINQKYEACWKDFKEEWDEKLAANGVDMIPSNKDRYAELVFSQPNYKSAQQKIDEKINNL